MICKFVEQQEPLQEVTTDLERLDEGELKDKLIISEMRESILNDSENDRMDVTLGVAESAHAFEVSLDVTGFQPEDLTVILQENQMTITGRHQDKSVDGTKQVERAFERKYIIPDDIERDRVKSNVTADGTVLKIVVPRLVAKSLELEEEKVTVRTTTTRRG